MSANRPHRRRGSLTAELLFVFPLLLGILLATVELALWLTAQQQVALASREGARTAATGGSEEAVNDAVRLVLGDARFARAQVQASLAVPSGEPVAVLVQLPAEAVVPDLLVF